MNLPPMYNLVLPPVVEVPCQSARDSALALARLERRGVADMALRNSNRGRWTRVLEERNIEQHLTR
jgi:hypothetical protein